VVLEVLYALLILQEYFRTFIVSSYTDTVQIALRFCMPSSFREFAHKIIGLILLEVHISLQYLILDTYISLEFIMFTQVLYVSKLEQSVFL
jgi:hypothetical protein